MSASLKPMRPIVPQSQFGKELRHLRLGLFVIAEIVFRWLLAPPCPDPEFAPLRRPLRGI